MATDIALAIDSIQRSFRCTRIVKGHKLARRDKQQPVLYSTGIEIVPDDPVPIINIKKNRQRRARRIDREMKGSGRILIKTIMFWFIASLFLSPRFLGGSFQKSSENRNFSEQFGFLVVRTSLSLTV